MGVCWLWDFCGVCCGVWVVVFGGDDVVDWSVGCLFLCVLFF